MHIMQCTTYGCPRDVTPVNPRYCAKHAEERKEQLHKFYRDKLNLPDEEALEIAEGAVTS